MDLLISVIAVVIALAVAVSIFGISSNTSRTNALLQELLVMQLMRDNASDNQINGVATARLISDAQRKYLLARWHEQQEA